MSKHNNSRNNGDPNSSSRNKNKFKNNRQKGSRGKNNRRAPATLSKRPKHQKLEIKFDPEARRSYLTGLSSRKQDRRAFGLAMQKVKDRKAKLEMKREEKKAEMEQIEEAERIKLHDMFGDYDSGSDSGGEDSDCEMEEGKKNENDKTAAAGDGDNNKLNVQTYKGDQIQNQFGGQVIVTTSYGIPSDDESLSEINHEISKSKKLSNAPGEKNKSNSNVDQEQKFAGSVQKYMQQLRKNLPSKKQKFQNQTGRAGKKGQHGAEKMIGGNAKDLKMAQRTLNRAQGNAKDGKGRGKGKGKKKGRR